MGALTRDAILSANDLPTEKVDVPEWGGHLFVRSMTGAERDAFEASLLKSDGSRDFTNFSARLVALCAVDDDGNRLFTEADVEALGKKCAEPLRRCSAAAQKLNGLAADSIEELEENS